jgi:orotidine-5'-phosphate decarboxylase
MNTTKNPLIVALDVPTLEEARKLLKELNGVASYYKIGMELFTSLGWEAVELVRENKASVFLDLKFHDIPNTVARTAAVVCRHEVEMFNIHTLGGSEMMAAVRKSVDGEVKPGKKKPVVLGVTILTSHSQEAFQTDLGIQREIRDQVLHLAKLAHRAGLDGVVCSPHEIELLRKEFPRDFVIVTPGIRPAGSAEQDQKRIMTPREAVEKGSDYIVVGRPVTASPNPRKTALEIIQTLEF